MIKEECSCGCGHNHHHKNEKEHRFLKISQLILSVLFLVFAILLEKIAILKPIAEFLQPVVFYLGAYLIVGVETINNALISIFKKDFFEENFLMSVATIAALVLGEFDEAVLSMIFFQFGELLEDIAIDKSHEWALELDSSCNEKENKITGFVNKFSKLYTPIICGCAIIIVLIPLILGIENINFWINKACVFLVISCPCAIVISLPLSNFISTAVINKNIKVKEEIIKVNKKIIIENIILVCVVKVLALTWSLFGTLPMWIAVLSDTGICLITILNDLRLFRIIKKKRG